MKKYILVACLTLSATAFCNADTLSIEGVQEQKELIIGKAETLKTIGAPLTYEMRLENLNRDLFLTVSAPTWERAVFKVSRGVLAESILYSFSRNGKGLAYY